MVSQTGGGTRDECQSSRESGGPSGNHHGNDKQGHIESIFERIRKGEFRYEDVHTNVLPADHIRARTFISMLDRM